MKRFPVIFVIVLASVWFINPAYSSDLEKFRTISEIGTLANTQDYTQALDKCLDALEKYPQEPELYYWSAVIKSRLGYNPEAVLDFDKAIELNPDNSSLYVMRGISKSELGNNTGALEDFDQALKVNPNDGSAYSMRACVKVEMGDLQGANEDLEMMNNIYREK